MIKNFRASRIASVATAALSLGMFAPAFAQTAPTSGPAETSPADITTADRVVIQGDIVYRNRSEEPAPVLEYGTDYFQRFEPLTVGDALKRVPSVSFLSDVLESDGVRLRGLDPAYTQILINGEKVPGAGSDSGAFGNGADGSFFVDRIPAELIERVEIVRSASANRSGDAMAGALNIVLRDGFALDGGYVRAGVLGFSDGRLRETLGAVWGGEALGGRLLLGANVQGRRNPKEKLSLRYAEPGDPLDNFETQTDVRNGTDTSFNLSYNAETETFEFGFDGFAVLTDRTQDEDSIEYLGSTRTPGAINVVNNNDVDITQRSVSLNSKVGFDNFGGRTKVKVGYGFFETREAEFEDEIEYRRDAIVYPEADRFTHDLIRNYVTDTEFKAKLEHVHDTGMGDMEVGLQYEMKQRENFNGEGRTRFNIAAGRSDPDASGAGLTIAQPAIVANPGGDNLIKRTQLAPYAMLSGKTGAFAWEGGLRYEQTDLSIEDRTVTGPARRQVTDLGAFLPSAHVKWSLSDADRLNFSVARTIRNPAFNFLSPATLTEELADNDFRGNAEIDPETAWGLDAGYERRLGKTGVAGINFFYRDVSDLIEVFNTGAVGSGGGATRVYSAGNTGDGKVWGVEFDYSAPLDFINLPDTGLFANVSWLDSEVTDAFGKRRFNSQSDFVYNIGFIHDMPSLGASFGATYRKQGDALSRVVGEEVETSYEGNLEVFVEKRFADRFTLRLTGSNLLDGSKDEVFHKFGSLADQISRDYDEFELETETAGPTWQLIGRMSF